MRKLIFVVSFSILVAVGVYALRARDSSASRLPKPAPIAATATAPAPSAGAYPKAVAGRRAPVYSGPAFDPAKKYAPGTYTPRGFAADYRDRIKHDFAGFAEARLGHPMSPEQAQKVAAVQDAFWDQHGPNVDRFGYHQISQPEFAERTHQDTIQFTEGMEKVFSDEEYQKLFDIPKGADAYPLLYHSKEEQPGMPVANLPSPTPSHAPNMSVMPQPGATAVHVDEGSPVPPTSTDKGAAKASSGTPTPAPAPTPAPTGAGKAGAG
ncbi:MAG TPA: hypothetical protein VF945_00570 [Polyangia bacterium]